jgi:hypothetical protein
MAEPRPSDEDLPQSDVDLSGIRDVIEDILAKPDAPAAPTTPGSGGGVIGGVAGLGGTAASNMLKGLFTDRDKDGIIDVFEPGNVTQVRNDAKVQDFLANALAQIGDKYQRGVENRFDNADPSKWDGSELVEWAANRAGVQVNDNPTSQYRQIVGKGGGVDIDDALHTPGAILYEFNGDPINGSPTRASTAISLGDGRIIDIDPKEGVRIIDAKGMHFTHAAVIPGFTDAHDPGAGALNVVHDALVKHGIEEAAPPVDDTPDIAALAARATELRAKYTDAQFGEGRTDRGEHRAEVERQEKLAELGLKMANEEAADRERKATERLAQATDLDTKAAAAEARGDRAGAQELREDAARVRAAGESDRALAENARGDAAKYQQQLDTAKAEITKLDDATGERFDLVGKGEPALDQLEQKVDLMRTANAQASLATDLDRRAAEARAAGDTTQADQLAQQAQSAHATATRMQQAADAVTIDETTLQQIQQLPDPGATSAPASTSSSTTAPAPDKEPETPPVGTETPPSPPADTAEPTATAPAEDAPADSAPELAPAAADSADTSGDLVGDVDAVAPTAAPAPAAEPSAEPAADATAAPDAEPAASAPADPSPELVADTQFDDAPSDTSDFAAPAEPEPAAATTVDDEL